MEGEPFEYTTKVGLVVQPSFASLSLPPELLLWVAVTRSSSCLKDRNATVGTYSDYSTYKPQSSYGLSDPT